MYKAASGALVFGAGTVQWSWGLEGSPDGSARPQHRTRCKPPSTCFADMGVQPTTLLSTLVAATASTDVTAPRSTITSPAAGAAVADGTTVTISGTATDTAAASSPGWRSPPTAAAPGTRPSGTAHWSYTWTRTGNSAPPIKRRASDDSGNIETPSAGRSINVT